MARTRGVQPAMTPRNRARLSAAYAAQNAVAAGEWDDHLDQLTAAIQLRKSELRAKRQQREDAVKGLRR